MEKRKSKRLINVIGIIIFTFFSLIIILYVSNDISIKDEENNKIEEFFKTEVEQKPEIAQIEQVVEAKKEETVKYTLLLEIPQIALKKGVFGIGLLSNTVSRNVQLIEGSDMPDVLKGNVIMAAHRGNSKISFFNKLDTLKNDATINIYYNGIKYVYKLTDKYEIDKTGSAKIFRDYDKSTVTLITCKKNDEKKQVVYIGYLYEYSIY